MINVENEKPLAEIRLTEEQVRTAILEFALKNEEFSDLVKDKSVLVTPVWQTTKWSNPDAFVHLYVAEATDEDLEGDNVQIREEVSAQGEEESDSDKSTD